MKIGDILGLHNIFKTNPKKQENKIANSFASNDLPNDIFQKVSSGFDNFGSLFATVTGSISRDLKRESEIANLFKSLEFNHVRSALKWNGNTKIEAILPPTISKSDAEYFSKLFKDSGINNFSQLAMFSECYNQNPKTKNVFSKQGIEAIKIYGLLNDKLDFSRFDELLLYIYNSEKRNNPPDFNRLNTTTEFLKQTGVKSIEELPTKFGHLGDKFNNFKTTTDKADAVDYMQETYPKKIDCLASMLNSKSCSYASDPQDTYRNIADVVDYLFEKNDGKSLEPLNKFINAAKNFNKMKSSILKECGEYFNGFKNVEDKIEFYELLTEEGLSIQDLNMLTGKRWVSDNEFLNSISNIKPVSKEISTLKQIDNNAAKKIYTTFKDFYDAVCDCSFEDVDGVKVLTNLIDRFNIKNSESLLKFYNASCGRKNKTVTTEEFRNFIELFNYTDSDAILSEAKSKQTTAIELLKQEKQNFMRVQDEIIDFILNDDSDYFADMAPLDIYKKYKDIINFNSPDSVQEVLSNSAKFDAGNSDEYKEKSENIKKFIPYFANKEDLKSFITKNGIKLTSDPKDEEYRNACFDIIDCLHSNRNEEDFNKIVEYLTKSGFLVKSKNSLSEFLSKIDDKEKLNLIFEAVNARQIKSINELNTFIKKYRSTSGNYDNLINHLLSCPQDVDFNEYIRIISEVQNRIDSLNIPARINNDNIEAIDVEKTSKMHKISDEFLFSMLNNIFNANKQGVNFIAKLPNATTKSALKHSSYRIAKEIADKVGSTNESYSNILRLLKLDRRSLGLDYDCSDYMYASCIENMLPQEFIDFVNSTEWIKPDKSSEKSLNIELHAKLRAIDRFILADCNSIDELYTKESIEKLRSLFSSVYVDTPLCIKGSPADKRFIINCNFNNNIIEAVFAKQGEIVTIVPKRKD